MKRLFLMLSVVALIVAACGDDDVFSGSTTTAAQTTVSSAETTTTAAPTTTEAETGAVDKGIKRDPGDAKSTVLSRASRAENTGKEIPDADTPEYGDRGSDPLLDVLWDDCAAGDMGACDELYRQSPPDSEYEEFGATCGATTDGMDWCETVVDVTDPYLYGVYDECHEGDMAACDTLYLESPAGSHFEWFGYTCGLISDGSVWCVDLIPDETTDDLDALYAACEAGDMQACDDLYLQSPAGSDYEDFGFTCGNRTDGSQWCVDTGLGTEFATCSYGDDPELDALWDDCAAGDMASCDALYSQSPIGSECEAFGDTCGERTPGGTWCVDEDIDGGSCAYGDNPELDSLWDECAGGDMQACDDLYVQSPYGSECEAFGDTCGGTTEGGTWCVGSTPSASPCNDAALDALYASCDGGDMQACDDLYMDSPAGSACELFGDTCGGTTGGGTWCAGTPDTGSACGDPALDALYAACDGGDMQACDDLFTQSDAGSECEAFGDTCGGTTSGGTWCVGSSPAPESPCGDAALDALYASCAGGDMQACDDLYMDSPVGSACETFGDTCGGTASGGTWCNP